MSALTGTGSSSAEQRYVLRDRESFFEAQSRNRRATWRLGVLCIAAVVVMGIPLALLVTPLVYAVGLFVADVVNLFWALPQAFWRQAAELAHFGFVALRALLDHKPAPPRALALGAAVLLAPGTILSLAVWVGMSALFRRAGVGGALLALNAREPNPAELKELQFADVVQEMAIAAGLPAPRVMLVDTPGANLAAIGSSPRDARIVASGRLLNDLSRDELEGAVAHSIASIGNGDLGVAFRITAVFETYGVLLAMLNSPFGPQSRSTLWRIVRSGLAGAGQDAAKEAAAVAAILTRSCDFETDDIGRFFAPTARNSAFRSIRNFIFFPFFFTYAAIRLSLWFFSSCMLGPSVALLWRTRKYLADACAVQLTRDPDGLARALRKLANDPGAIQGSGWAAHLFLVQPQSSGSSSEAPNPRQSEILARAWVASRQHSDAARSGGDSAAPANIAGEVVMMYRAAIAGDAQAMARMAAARQELTALDPALAARMPDPADFAAIRKGDAAAMARLRAFGRQVASPEKGMAPSSGSNREDSSGVLSVSLVGFYPSLERRLKRLERMGAHVDSRAEQSSWMLAAVFGLIFAPFLLLVVALLLFLIAVMTLGSLTFMVVWLAFIHKIFGLAAHH